jgi:predicted PurR-regulated permease PerM
MSDTRAGGITTPRPIAQAAAPHASQTMTLFVMIVATLYFGKEVLMPVTLALLLAFVLAPMVNLLRRAHLGRVPSVLLAVTLALCVVLAIGGVIGSQIGRLTTDIPRYAETVETKATNVRNYTIGRLSHLADEVGASKEKSETSSSASTSSQPSPEASPPTAPQVFGSTPLALTERYLSPVLSPVATFGIVFVVAVFALLQKEDLRDRMILLIGSDDLHRTTVVIDDGARRLSRYFLSQLIINTAFGVIIGAGLLLIGLPYPVLWGIVSALLRFVPYVGSLISAVLPIALAAAVEPGWSMMAWTAGLYVVVEGLTGQVVEPLVYGHSTGLSPFSVVVAAIFWSWLWGPVGLILSTPLTLCLVVMGRHVKRLEFLDVLLGDRPTLTLTETLYQRILAGDADEAQDHAELILKERSLGTYYDEIVVKAMQLAASDAGRGIIDREQLERVSSTIKVLVRGLDTYKDEKISPKKSETALADRPLDGPDLPPEPDPQNVPPAGIVLPQAWVEKSPIVLCIAGRGPLDETTSVILIQLLEKHGFNGRLVKYDDVSREKIETLDTANVAIVCVSFLDIGGSPAHLRYLIQRLRRRLQGVQIIVGIWQSEDAAQRDDAARTAIGANALVGSLEGTVTLCVQTAIKAADGEAPPPTVTPAIAGDEDQITTTT